MKLKLAGLFSKIRQMALDMVFWVKISLVGIKAKLFIMKKLVFWSGVSFLIRCILDYTQCHLVDFWKKSPANFNFIWLEWNSYNSSIQIHIVWSRSSIFKLKSSPAQGCDVSSRVQGNSLMNIEYNYLQMLTVPNDHSRTVTKFPMKMRSLWQGKIHP